MLRFLDVSVGFDPVVARIRRFSLIEPCVSQNIARLLNKKSLCEGSIHCSEFNCRSRCCNFACSWDSSRVGG